jgi:hypothetical protein
VDEALTVLTYGRVQENRPWLLKLHGSLRHREEDRGPCRTAGPLGEGISANQIGTEVIWPKYGGPHRPRPAALASCSAAAISSAPAEGWP